MKKGPSITLDPKLGVNPHMTFCQRCGGDAQELMLLGDRKYKLTCSSCGTVNIGARPRQRCGRCKEPLTDAKRELIGEYERLPAMEPCDACKEQIQEFAAIVKAGGIHVKCKQCSIKGVVRAEEGLAKYVREQMKIAPPDTCGMEFQTCQEHQAEEKAE
jgi:hypothetical protein